MGFIYDYPVQIVSTIGQRSLAIAGEAQNRISPLRDQKMIPRLGITLGSKFRPEFLDNSMVTWIEYGNPMCDG